MTFATLGQYGTYRLGSYFEYDNNFGYLYSAFDTATPYKPRATYCFYDAYRYRKAINANSTLIAATSGGGIVPFDALIAFVGATNSPGSNAYGCLFAPAAPVGTSTTAGGDFETQLFAWLAAGTTATPAGLGLSSSTSPTLAATIAALQTSALNQGF